MDIIEFMNYYGLVAGKRTMSVLYDLRKEAWWKASVKYLVSMWWYEHIVALIGEKEWRRTAIELQEIIDRMSPIFTKMFGHLV
jgi:hypothetical protein